MIAVKAEKQIEDQCIAIFQIGKSKMLPKFKTQEWQEKTLSQAFRMAIRYL